jgi:hypothetical protein
MDDDFKYNPNCIAEVDGCVHAIQLNEKLMAVSGLEVYAHLKKLGRPIHEHFQRYADEDIDNVPVLPDEDDDDL